MGDVTPRQIRIRDAVPGDALSLAQLTIMAGHGLHEIFYGGLIAGKSTAEIIAERRIRNPTNFSSLAWWRVAIDGQGQTLGALNSFPHLVFAASAPDPLLTAERQAVAGSITELEASATGTYYINIIAVVPERRSGGIGAALMAEGVRLASLAGFGQLALSTFEADVRLLDFYRRHGFKIADTRPIEPHPGLDYGGNWALMTRSLSET